MSTRPRSSEAKWGTAHIKMDLYCNAAGRDTPSLLAIPAFPADDPLRQALSS